MSIVEVVRKTTTVVEVGHPGVQGPPGTGTAAVAAHAAAANPHSQYPLASSLATVATSGAYADLSGKPSLGTAAPLNVPASGDATAGEVVKGNDSRLTNARAPTAHTHQSTDINDSTTAGRAVLTAADAAAQRTALGVPAGSGNSTGTNTGDQTNITGNAGTATALQTARNINGVAFDGTANITINAVDSTARVAKAGDTMTGALNWAATQTIASAATTDIGAATSNSVIVSGTTTITALGTIAAGAERVVQFSGALTLTHNATSLILPGGANINTAAGDVAYFVSLGAGNWRCTGYQKASGQAVVASGGSPGGSSGNLQANNGAGGFTGVTSSSVSGANITLGGSLTSTLGTFISTVADGPSAVAFNKNSAVLANASAILERWQNNGTTRMTLLANGTLKATSSTGGVTLDVSGGNATYNIQPSTASLRMLNSSSSGWIPISASVVGVTTRVAFGSIPEGGTLDTGIERDAAGVTKSTDGAGNLRDHKARNLIATGNIARGIVAKTASYTVTANDGVIECDATSAAITLTLPAVASATPGATYTLKKTDSSGNAVIWDGNASETIDGATTVQTTTQWASITVMPNAARTAWLTIKD